MTGGTFNLSSAGTDLGRIPSKDAYGNSTTGNAYRNSHVVGGGAFTSVFNGTDLDQTQVNRDYHWGLAMWNAVDSAAFNIRSDANQPSRAGDTSTMSIQIFAIGYTGNGGTDILLQNDNSLQSWVWQLTGTSITAGGSIGTPQSGWHIPVVNG